MLGSSLITEQVETLYLFSLRTKACARFGSSVITEQVESLHLFPLRTEVCARFEPNHRTCGNLLSILSKDRSLCSIQA